MKAIAVPCPDCYRSISTFQMSVNENATIVLSATCHTCRVITQLTVTFDDLRDLGAGKEVPMRPAGQPAWVM